MMAYRALLGTALVLLPAMAPACEYLTPDFVLCSEGTPWASGTWENGGDSATLYVDGIGYEGFGPFYGRDDGRPLDATLDHLLAFFDENHPRTHRQADRLTTDHLTVVRSIDTMLYETHDPAVVVTMLAEGGGRRIQLSVSAPVDTPLDRLDRLSRDYAALVRPRSDVQDN